MQDYISAKGEQDLAKNRLAKVKGVNWDVDARNYDPKTDCIMLAKWQVSIRVLSKLRIRLRVAVKRRLR